MATDPGDLVLDPTCGSGTSAFVAEQWGRRWITVDTSRVALTLARTRIMAARYPYYLLADSPEGISKEAEITGHNSSSFSTSQDVKRGFVYKRVPHITLGAIANNPDIEIAMSSREKEAAISRHAEHEYLFDQPYEDPKRIRVSGPFTVESLSPHRLLDPREDAIAKDVDSSLSSEIEAADFRTQILDNLRKAGIQNTKKHERLVFDALDPHSGAWIHAKGRYTDKDGNPKFVAVSIGPKYGTITPQHVQEAAKEAIKGAGHHLLVILGFAFGGYVSDEVKQFGELTILIVRMNPDLMMGDELLKKTGAGNLFTVFGEPDIDYTLKDGLVTVSIKGVDIYDPTTGEVRSSKPEEIACWFIDTDYNDESFFVRHAYFLGDDEPYEKLKRALKAEVDEAAWSQLYSAKSRPFEKPSTSRFAVKVINHYGDEVMKVFEVK
jgi:adenine-specific DNA-methyltransferase